MNFYIGTSGYYYDSWKDGFLPNNTKDHLEYYSKYFNSVEVNNTFYRIFSQDHYKKMIDKVPDNFKFIVKVNQTITHIRDNHYLDEIKAFNRSIRPLIKSQKYGGILIQFPYAFKYGKENMRYLEKLIRYLPIKKTIEFRHHSWSTPFVINYLNEQMVAIANLDMPDNLDLFPPLNLITSNSIYYRFHGRSKEKWWNYKEPYERHNYYYSKEELSSLKKRIEDTVKDKDLENVYIFFNNYYCAKSIKNALTLGGMMGILDKSPLLQDSLFE
jgi:uncharacterized protein YecE (DUF72 family)